MICMGRWCMESGIPQRRSIIWIRGIAGCLVVPDEFNVGYQSLTEAAEILTHYFHKMHDRTVSYTVLRRDTLFSKENQEIIFTMSQ